MRLAGTGSRTVDAQNPEIYNHGDYIRQHHMCRPQFFGQGSPQQNGHIESFHNTLKREYIWPHDFANYQEAEAVIAEAFRDYN